MLPVTRQVMPHVMGRDGMRTVFWEDNRLKMIDQRLLPGEFAIAEFTTVEEVAYSIRDMVVRGAPAIGATGAYGMVVAALQSSATDRAGLLADLAAAREVLDASRPTAVNLSWATQRMLQTAEHSDLQDMADLRRLLLAEAEALADEDVEINRRMGFNGADIIPDGANLLHHCNTGALAAVDWGTALGVIFALQEQGKQIHVWVDETRPRLQGARLTAWELMRAEIPMHLIADNAAGHLMRTGQVDAVIFGADRVAANGDVANKIGSYKLAVVARENGIPVYSVVPTSTIDLNLPDGDHIPIEERDSREVTHIGSANSDVEKAVNIAPEGVPVYNPAFDVTPHKYLTAIITEEGVCYPPFTVTLRRAKEAAEARVRANRAGRTE
jgi:methylthioribose-1-phosphate isomerase